MKPSWFEDGNEYVLCPLCKGHDAGCEYCEHTGKVTRQFIEDTWKEFDNNEKAWD